MAYAALVSLARLLEHILDRNQHRKHQIQSLHEKIVFLSTFLEDFPTEAARIEARITVAANQAEDTFEYHMFNQENQEKLHKELLKPIREIDSILEEVMQIKSSRTGENQISSHSSASFSSGLAPMVVVFEDDLMKIQERLCGKPSSKLKVIPIVGMGGIGKTTLARYALDDSSTFYHFDVRAWVTVSQNYNMHSLLLSLLNSIDASTKGQYTSLGTALLVQRVYKYLKMRRYLIVVDDIWNANVWDVVRMVFPDDLNGSRIILTTRDLQVASYVDSSNNPHKMHLMGVDESWNLLKLKVFAEEHCPPELEEIGKLIAEKCRGLPLAVTVIGGVLSKVNKMEDTWKSIAENVK